MAGAVLVTIEKIHQPVVNGIWDISLCHLFKESVMPDSVKRLTKIESDGYDVLLG